MRPRSDSDAFAKVWVDLLDKPHFLSALEAQGTHVGWVWVALIMIVKRDQTNGRLLRADRMPMTYDDIAAAVKTPVALVTSAMLLYLQWEWVVIKDKTFVLPNYQRRQGLSKAAIRMRRFRDAQTELGDPIPMGGEKKAENDESDYLRHSDTPPEASRVTLFAPAVTTCDADEKRHLDCLGTPIRTAESIPLVTDIENRQTLHTPPISSGPQPSLARGLSACSRSLGASPVPVLDLETVPEPCSGTPVRSRSADTVGEPGSPDNPIEAEIVSEGGGGVVEVDMFGQPIVPVSKAKSGPRKRITSVDDDWGVILRLYADLVVPAGGGRTVLLEGGDTALRQRLGSLWRRQPTEDWWRAFFQRIAASPFLTGNTHHNFGALSLRWLVASDNRIAAVLEGRYDGGGATRRMARSIQASMESAGVTEADIREALGQ